MPNSETAKTDVLLRNQPGKLSDKVLFIIDDDETILEVICSHLEIQGFQSANLHKFPASAEALEIIRFVRPDLIISDIHMPGISGDTLAKLIQWPEFKNSPVIAITGDNDFKLDSSTGTFLDEVVYKPINGVDLMSKVQKILTIAERRQRAAQQDGKERTQQQNRSIQNKENGLRAAFGKD